MKNLKMYPVVAGLLIIAFSAGRFSAPKSVSTQSSEQTQTDTTKNVDKNQNVVETTKETHLPDGTVVIEKHKEKETTSQTQTQRSSETSKSASATTENRPSYRLGVGYEPAIKGFQDVGYSVTIEKRLFSEIYLGVTGSSRHTIGLSLSLGF